MSFVKLRLFLSELLPFLEFLNQSVLNPHFNYKLELRYFQLFYVNMLIYNIQKLSDYVQALFSISYDGGLV